MKELLHYVAATIDISPLPKVTADDGRLDTIVSVVMTITGSIAFLVLVAAGYKYVTSQGDPQAVAKAKNTIIYAAVGLVVSISAYAIVAFVISGTG